MVNRGAHMNGSDTTCLCFSYDGQVLASRGGNYTKPILMKTQNMILVFQEFYFNVRTIFEYILKLCVAVLPIFKLFYDM